MVYIFVAASILCWGSSATISKYFFGGVSMLSILAWNSLVAFIFMAVLSAIHGKLKNLLKLPIKTIAAMAAVGSVSILFYTYFLQMGMQVLPGQQAFVIQYLWPAMIIIWSVPINKEPVTAGKLIAILFSFSGVVVVAVNGNVSQLLGGNLFGVVMCLLAAVSYGLYSALIKRMTFDKEQALVVGFGFAAIVSFAGMFIAGDHTPVTGFLMIGYTLYGLIVNAIPFLLWALALSRGNTAVIANLAYLTPVVSLFFTHFILGEEITVFSVLGLVLILLGIAAQLLIQRRSVQHLTI